MFGIGFSELLLIVVAALVLIGPKELPQVLRQIVRFFREITATTDSVKRQMRDVLREAGMDDITQATREIIDLDGKKQIAYDVSELEALRKKPEGGA